MGGCQLRAIDQGPGGLDQGAISEVSSRFGAGSVSIIHIIARLGLVNILDVLLRYMPHEKGDALIVAASTCPENCTFT